MNPTPHAYRRPAPPRPGRGLQPQRASGVMPGSPPPGRRGAGSAGPVSLRVLTAGPNVCHRCCRWIGCYVCPAWPAVQAVLGLVGAGALMLLLLLLPRKRGRLRQIEPGRRAAPPPQMRAGVPGPAVDAAAAAALRLPSSGCPWSLGGTRTSAVVVCLLYVWWSGVCVEREDC